MKMYNKKREVAANVEVYANRHEPACIDNRDVAVSATNRYYTRTHFELIFSNVSQVLCCDLNKKKIYFYHFVNPKLKV